MEVPIRSFEINNLLCFKFSTINSSADLLVKLKCFALTYTVCTNSIRWMTKTEVTEFSYLFYFRTTIQNWP